MGVLPARTNLPTGEPIVIYRKSRSKFLLKSILPIGLFLVFLLLILNRPSGIESWRGITILMGVVIVYSTFLIWDMLRSKIERYADALVIYTAFRRTICYRDDMDALSSEYVKSNKFTGYTEYTLQRRDGIKIHFTDEFHAHLDLVVWIQLSLHYFD